MKLEVCIVFRNAYLDSLIFERDDLRGGGMGGVPLPLHTRGVVTGQRQALQHQLQHAHLLHGQSQGLPRLLKHGAAAESLQHDEVGKVAQRLHQKLGHGLYMCMHMYMYNNMSQHVQKCTCQHIRMYVRIYCMYMYVLAYVHVACSIVSIT